jgi:hypothetical protein
VVGWWRWSARTARPVNALAAEGCSSNLSLCGNGWPGPAYVMSGPHLRKKEPLHAAAPPQVVARAPPSRRPAVHSPFGQIWITASLLAI